MANDILPSVVLSLPTVVPLNQIEAWEEVEKDAEAIANNGSKRRLNADVFPPPPSTNPSACNAVFRGLILDYEKNVERFPGRPNKITRCRRGGLIFLPGRTPNSTNLMIIQPIHCEGKSTIGNVKVDMNHYYVILNECDIEVKPGSKLVVLAMPHIE
ncbi:uncharacterized protein N7483_009473 [Penicillium malachiteum]|uniref:uncharacterized protein n=1 Tax=Penicillium malachiteum TaxID=1324776 RepID=UPI0025470CD9|nr:uncharacterized protein N7483_009473 [Penicillium malachiteum]KAJ5721539.1 hypothetical protein N7483_009473 [Penicillium malachiteum]